MHLLDSNICIYILKNKFLQIQSHIEAVGIENVSVSSITVAELEYGAAKSNNPDQARSRWRTAEPRRRGSGDGSGGCTGNSSGLFLTCRSRVVRGRYPGRQHRSLFHLSGFHGRPITAPVRQLLPGRVPIEGTPGGPRLGGAGSLCRAALGVAHGASQIIPFGAARIPGRGIFVVRG